jgi:amidase
LLITKNEIGGDQGGSIRIPSSFCGLVGLKPTHGLVPYTGIVSLEPTIDHAGPMTKSVKDNAILLEVIAGLDGMDDRQVAVQKVLPKYSNISDDVKGMKIGLLTEAFNVTGMQPSVAAKVRDAAAKFKDLGAIVEEVWLIAHL